MTADFKLQRQRLCKRGHDLADAPMRNGSRHCRKCSNIRNREYKKRHQERLRATRKRYEKPKVVTCPDCGGERVVKGTPIGKRCKPCANKAATVKPRKTCAHCGKEFYRSNTLAEFCSMACRKASGQYVKFGDELSAKRKGKGNPNYRHGRRRGEHFRGWSASAKGELFCRVCGKGGLLHLHHAVPRFLCPPEAKEDLRNGIPLCPSCHQGWHHRAVTIHRHLFTRDEWDYLSSMELTGREITAWLDDNYPEAVAA